MTSVRRSPLPPGSRAALATPIGLALVLAVLLALPAAAQVDQQINSDPAGTLQNEVRIAMDLGLPQSMVVAYNDKAGGPPPTPIGISWTSDGGVSWSDTQLGVPPDPFNPGSFLSTIFDPCIAFAPPNAFVAGYIATTATPGGPSGLYVERSMDGGMTWQAQTAVDIQPGGLGPMARFNDRCHLVSHPAALLNMTWIQDVGFNQPTSDVLYSFSNPPQVSFSFTPPVIVNDSSGVDMANAPHVSAHPTTAVYVAWIDVNVTVADPTSGTIKLDRTTVPTANPVFGPDTNVITIDPLPRFLSTASGSFDDARAGSYPFVLVDPNDGTANRVWIAYAADPAGPDEGDIFFIKSNDGGNTWGTPIRLNDDSTTNDQFHPVLAVLGGSSLLVAWYDKRNSPNDDSWDVYAARSVDAGNSFLPNVRMTQATFATPVNAGTPWLGEYMGLETDGVDALLAFTSSVNDPLGDVFFERRPICSMPPPRSYCTAGTTTSGCRPSLSSAGTPSWTNSGAFTISATGVEAGKQGLIFYGINGRLSKPWGSGTSFLCVKAPTQRTSVQNSGGTPGTCTGAYLLDWNAYVAANPLKAINQALTIGSTVDAQAWFRDPPASKTTNLSDGLEFVVCL